MFLIQPKGGLANRLRFMLAYHRVAKAQHRPLFCFWEPDDKCPGDFREFFSPVYHPVYNSLQLKLMKRLPGVTYAQGNDVPRSVFQHFNMSVPADGMTQLYVWLKLNSRMQKDLAEADVRIAPSRCIGLHIRRTDHVELAVSRTGKYSTDLGFERVIEEGIALNPKARFFLATDNAETQKKFLDRWPAHIAVYKTITANQNLRQTSLHQAIIEAFILARCPEIYGSTWSSYSELAFFLSAGGAKFRQVAD